MVFVVDLLFFMRLVIETCRRAVFTFFKKMSLAREYWSAMSESQTQGDPREEGEAASNCLDD